MLSELALKDFKQIYQDEFGVEMADEEATGLAINLLNLFNHIHRPVKKDWLLQFEEAYKNKNV